MGVSVYGHGYMDISADVLLWRTIQSSSEMDELSFRTQPLCDTVETADSRHP